MSRCTGEVLVTKAPGNTEIWRCQSDAADGSDICPFHKVITEKCLSCGGTLLHLDGDLFCSVCGRIVEEVPEEMRLD